MNYSQRFLTITAAPITSRGSNGLFISLKSFASVQFTGIILGLLLSIPGTAQQWDSLNLGLNERPTKMFYDSATGELIVGGSFRKADNKWIVGIGAWNGAQWDSLGHGFDFYDTTITNTPGNVWAIERYGNCLYAGGVFQKAGHISSNSFARFDGTEWDSVPGGDIPQFKAVNDIMIYNNELYVCGDFDSIGNISANGIAKWDGTTWSCIGTNYPFTTGTGRLGKMKYYHGNLYVAGMFEDPNGNSCRLAKWDGSTWTFYTNELAGGTVFLYDLEVYNDELYVSGLFYSSAGNVGNSIVRWNDTTWRDVGGSVQIGANASPIITDMVVAMGKLFCVGNFEIIGGVSANYLASWDGTLWCGYGTSFDNRINQIAFCSDTLYIGGGFKTINGDSIPWIAKWIGGSFVDTCGTAVGIVDPVPTQSSVLVFPNPSNTVTTFLFSDSSTSREIVITDQLGREVWRKETSESTVEFPASEFAAGMYFYSIHSDSPTSITGKFIISH